MGDVTLIREVPMSEPNSRPSPDSQTGDMPAEEFRAAGHRLIDWIADYMEHADRYPVLARTAPVTRAAGCPVIRPNDPSRSTRSSPTSRRSSFPA